MPNLLIKKEKLNELCLMHGYGYHEINRIPLTDAFRTAFHYTTSKMAGEIRLNLLLTKKTHSKNVWKVHVIDPNTYAQKLLATFTLLKNTQTLQYTIETFEPRMDALAFCRQIENGYNEFLTCAGKNYLEGLLDGLLTGMDTVKVSIHGRLYFFPASKKSELETFTEFITAIVTCNLDAAGRTPKINYIPVPKNEKQCEYFAAEFYFETNKVIQEYTAKLNQFYSSGGGSQATLSKWHLKIAVLEERIRNFQQLFDTSWERLDQQMELLTALLEKLSTKAG